MNGPDQNGKVSRSKGRGCLIWLVRGLAVFLRLALVGYLYEHLAEAADAKVYPPPVQWTLAGIACTSIAQARAAPPW